MKRPRLPLLRGLTVQILAITVLPLTLLLLLIASGTAGAEMFSNSCRFFFIKPLQWLE